METREPKVYDLQMQPSEAHLWADVALRKDIIAGGVSAAKEVGCRVLRVLDTEGRELYIEGFGPRLWDLVREAHEKIDEEVATVQREAKAVHALLQDALYAYDRGDVAASHVAIKQAMDLEYDLFGECHTGEDALLEELGYDIEQDMPLMSMG
jgi:hypothetical protein